MLMSCDTPLGVGERYCFKNSIQCHWEPSRTSPWGGCVFLKHSLFLQVRNQSYCICVEGFLFFFFRFGVFKCWVVFFFWLLNQRIRPLLLFVTKTFPKAGEDVTFTKHRDAPKGDCTHVGKDNRLSQAMFCFTAKVLPLAPGWSQSKIFHTLT